jgi:hypothetical protein
LIQQIIQAVCPGVGRNLDGLGGRDIYPIASFGLGEDLMKTGQGRNVLHDCILYDSTDSQQFYVSRAGAALFLNLVL